MIIGFKGEISTRSAFFDPSGRDRFRFRFRFRMGRRDRRQDRRL